MKLYLENREAKTRHSDRNESARRLHGNGAGEMAAGCGRQPGRRLRGSDANMLRHHSAPGISSGLSVDYLSDATGTLPVQNSAGAISDRDLHRAVLGTMGTEEVDETTYGIKPQVDPSN